MEQISKYLVGYELPEDQRWYKWRDSAMKHLIHCVIEPTVYSKKTSVELNKKIEDMVNSIKSADTEEQFDSINTSIMSMLPSGSVIANVEIAPIPDTLVVCGKDTDSIHLLVNETIRQYNKAIDKLVMPKVAVDEYLQTDFKLPGHDDTLPDNIDNPIVGPDGQSGGHVEQPAQQQVEQRRIDIALYRQIVEYNNNVETLASVRKALSESSTELCQIDPNLELVKSKRDYAARLLNGTVERLRIADIPVRSIAGAFDQPMLSEIGLVVIVAVIIVIILLIVRALFLRNDNPTAIQTVTYKESFEQPQSTGTDDVIENSLRV